MRPPQHMMHIQALYKYTAAQEGQLTFAKNDLFFVLHRLRGWYFATSNAAVPFSPSAQVGLVPINFFKVLQTDVAAGSQQEAHSEDQQGDIAEHVDGKRTQKPSSRPSQRQEHIQEQTPPESRSSSPVDASKSVLSRRENNNGSDVSLSLSKLNIQTTPASLEIVASANDRCVGGTLALACEEGEMLIVIAANPSNGTIKARNADGKIGLVRWEKIDAWISESGLVVDTLEQCASMLSLSPASAPVRMSLPSRHMNQTAVSTESRNPGSSSHKQENYGIQTSSRARSPESKKDEYARFPPRRIRDHSSPSPSPSLKCPRRPTNDLSSSPLTGSSATADRHAHTEISSSENAKLHHDSESSGRESNRRRLPMDLLGRAESLRRTPPALVRSATTLRTPAYHFDSNSTPISPDLFSKSGSSTDLFPVRTLSRQTNHTPISTTATLDRRQQTPPTLVRSNTTGASLSRSPTLVRSIPSNMVDQTESYSSLNRRRHADAMSYDLVTSNPTTSKGLSTTPMNNSANFQVADVRLLDGKRVGPALYSYTLQVVRRDGSAVEVVRTCAQFYELAEQMSKLSSAPISSIPDLPSALTVGVESNYKQMMVLIAVQQQRQKEFAAFSAQLAQVQGIVGATDLVLNFLGMQNKLPGTAATLMRSGTTLGRSLTVATINSNDTISRKLRLNPLRTNLDDITVIRVGPAYHI